MWGDLGSRDASAKLYSEDISGGDVDSCQYIPQGSTNSADDSGCKTENVLAGNMQPCLS